MARNDIVVFTAFARGCGFRRKEHRALRIFHTTITAAQKDAAELWGKLGRARTGLGRGGVGM
jgi:hypothetical protein